MRITRDYREDSVVAGFASIGGLWTFFSGIISLIFGVSLLQILFGQYESNPFYDTIG